MAKKTIGPITKSFPMPTLCLECKVISKQPIGRGAIYLARQAQGAAQLLGLGYRAIDITHNPTVAAERNLFFPGTIAIDDFQLVYPGTPEQIAESYRHRGPLPGQQSYTQRPQGKVERLVAFSAANPELAFSLCQRNLTPELICTKREWLTQFAKARVFAGAVGYSGDAPVAYAEILPETAIPYPIGEKRADRAFITCLYSPNEWGLVEDYRQACCESSSPAQGAGLYRCLSGKWHQDSLS